MRLLIKSKNMKNPRRNPKLKMRCPNYPSPRHLNSLTKQAIPFLAKVSRLKSLPRGRTLGLNCPSRKCAGRVPSERSFLRSSVLKPYKYNNSMIPILKAIVSKSIKAWKASDSWAYTISMMMMMLMLKRKSCLRRINEY